MKLGDHGETIGIKEAEERHSLGRLERLQLNLAKGKATVGVVGMGYVGQPLAITAHSKGFRVVGFDIDAARVAALNGGRSTIRTIPDGKISSMLVDGCFRATNEIGDLSEMDVIVICVPTPLNKYREPDLSHVERTAQSVGAVLRRDQLVCLESTTYPGCTTEIVKPAMEASGLKMGEDVFLA